MREFVPVLIAGLTPFVILVLIIAGVGLGLVQWQPQTLWVNEFGTALSSPNNKTTVGAIATQGNNIYAAGIYNLGPCCSPINPTQSYLFLSGYSTSGQQIWTSRIGDWVYSQIVGIGVGDGIYVGGGTNGTGFVEKYDLRGNRIWRAQFGNASLVFGGGGGFAASISAQPSAVYVGGVSPDNTTKAIILNKYDLQGRLVWSRALGKSSSFQKSAVSIYSDSHGIYVTGWSEGALYSGTRSPYLEEYDENGVMGWSQSLNSTSHPCDCIPVGVASDGSGVIISGYVNTPYGYNAFLSKYDWTGNVVWTKQFSSPEVNAITSLSLSANSSGSYLAIATSNVAVCSIAKYDYNGGSAWTLKVTRYCGLILVGDSALYMGGGTSENQAFLAAFGLSSTLILFGVNPPGSFLLAAGLVGAVVLSTVFIYLRKRAQSNLRRRPKLVLPNKGLPADVSDSSQW